MNYKTDTVGSNEFCMAVKKVQEEGFNLDLVNSSKDGRMLTIWLSW